MDRDTFSAVTERPAVDYAHLPGEEHNPLMESTAHVDWSVMLLNSARHALAGTNDLVTGNVPFSPDDGGPHTAPDLMVLPGAAGTSFGRYTPGIDGPLPTVCIEIISPSNTRAEITRKCTRLLRLGVSEVYVVDPRRDTVVQASLVGDELKETNAVGMYSPGMKLSFTTQDHHLAVCCPGGRTVRPGDDPFGWLVEEMNRADAESLRADMETERATALMSSLADRDRELADRDRELADRDRELAERGRSLGELRAEIERLRSSGEA
jgi:Uma2 family endonuclease